MFVVRESRAFIDIKRRTKLCICQGVFFSDDVDAIVNFAKFIFVSKISITSLYG